MFSVFISHFWPAHIKSENFHLFLRAELDVLRFDTTIYQKPFQPSSSSSSLWSEPASLQTTQLFHRKLCLYSQAHKRRQNIFLAIFRRFRIHSSSLSISTTEIIKQNKNYSWFQLVNRSLLSFMSFHFSNFSSSSLCSSMRQKVLVKMRNFLATPRSINNPSIFPSTRTIVV